MVTISERFILTNKSTFYPVLKYNSINYSIISIWILLGVNIKPGFIVFASLSKSKISMIMAGESPQQPWF